MTDLIQYVAFEFISPSLTRIFKLLGEKILTTKPKSALRVGIALFFRQCGRMAIFS